MTTPPTSTPRRRGSALRWLLALLVALPLVEIVVLVAVGRAIGLWWTVGLVVAMALVGAWLSRRESGRTWRALQQSLASGRMPTDEMTDAILVTAGALLLLLPGFVSDVVGLALIAPFTRPAARRLLQILVARQAVRVGVDPRRGGASRGAPGAGSRRGEGQVIEGEVVSETPPPGGPASGPSSRTLEP